MQQTCIIQGESRCDSRCEFAVGRRQSREFDRGDKDIQLPLQLKTLDGQHAVVAGLPNHVPGPYSKSRDAVKASRRCIWLLAVRCLMEHLEESAQGQPRAQLGYGSLVHDAPAEHSPVTRPT